MKTEWSSSRKKILIIAAIMAVVISIRLSGVTEYLTFENLKSHRHALLQYVHLHYANSSILFIVIYVIVAALSIPGAAVLTLAGGFLFSTIPAVIFCNIGATIGALCAFFITRHLIGNWVHKRYESQLRKFNDEVARNGTYYLLFLRLIPIFPFFLINMFAGLTKVPLRKFLWTTTIGILPGDTVYAFAGSQLGTITSVEDVFSRKILLAFALLALFALIPALYNHLKSRSKEQG
jgi:uncharacterized membrane protein YdjX (TVP38/TMEM64 family)